MAVRQKPKWFTQKADREASYLQKKLSRDTAVLEYAKTKKPSRASARTIAKMNEVITSAKKLPNMYRIVRQFDQAEAFADANPAKFRPPVLFSGRKIMDIGGFGKPPGPGLGGLAGRYARTGSGRIAIGLAGAAVGAGVGIVFDEAIEYVGSVIVDRFGDAFTPKVRILDPTLVKGGIGIYFRNRLLGLLTSDQYDQFWVSAATHIRKLMKAL